MRQWIMTIVIVAGALGQSACKAPARPISGEELAQSQREYLQFYTDAELLAQAEAKASDLSTPQGQARRDQLAMAPKQPVADQLAPPPPPPPPPTPTPPTPVEVVPEPAPMPEPVQPQPKPAPMPQPAVAEVTPTPTPPTPKPIVVNQIQPAPRPRPAVVAGAGRPWLDILIRQPSAENATAALKDMTQRDVAAQVEAIRTLCSLRPHGGEQELYITAFTNVSPFVREVGISALLRAYGDSGDAWARRLLETRGGREEDRFDLAQIVIRNGAKDAYPLAIEALGSDFTGGALFEARRDILTAGNDIVPALTRLALRMRRTTSGRIARRLYRWIQRAGSIKEAYYDTFTHDPSEYAVIMFRERYGQEAQPLLRQALGTASPTMAGYINQALQDINNPDAAMKPRPRSTASRAYLIVYTTPTGAHRILTDTPIWPHQVPGEIEEHATANGTIRQKSIGMKPEQLEKLRNVPATALPSIRVDNQGIDRLDMSRR